MAMLLSYCVQPPPTISTSMMVPSGPLVGEIHVWRSSVKVASAADEPLATASIRWGGPPRSYGVTKDAVHAPLEPATALATVLLTSTTPDPLTRFPSMVYHRTSTAAPEANPPPVTVTKVPGGPEVGLTVMDGSARTPVGTRATINSPTISASTYLLT